MEFKTIVYILLGIIYFLYSISNNKKEQKQNTPKADSPKPVEPPSLLKDILAEIQRKQREEEARQQFQLPIPPPEPAKKTLISSASKTKSKPEVMFEEGVSTTVAQITEPRAKRGNTNSEIYSIKSSDEIEAEQAAFELDIRKAVIGSVILETKF